jgi:hypothetical protein
MAHDPDEVLRRHLVICSAYDAMAVVKSAGKMLPAGTNLIVFLDEAGRYVTHWSVVDGDDDLEFVVDGTCELAPPPATGAFLVSVRTGEVPADRPGDERPWCELGGIAEDAGIDLLDWFVVCGTIAFSVAEHAEVPAGWPTTRDAVEAHPELRYDPNRPHRSSASGSTLRTSGERTGPRWLRTER